MPTLNYEPYNKNQIYVVNKASKSNSTGHYNNQESDLKLQKLQHHTYKIKNKRTKIQ